MAGKGKENKISLTEMQIKNLEGAFKRGSFSDLSSQLQATLRSLENICLDVGITGESGVGKSTFINTFRDLRAEDEGAAPAGGSSNSQEPTAYSHPKYTNVILWDLPRIDAPDFHPRDYLQKINSSRYDFFIILASGNFTVLHGKLAQYIEKSGKDFYFVRSKIDEDIELARREHPPSFDEAAVLQKIRDDCLRDLQAAGVKVSKIFLISNLVFSKYDFPLLGETLWKDLDLQKSHSFILATPNISHRLLEKKKKAIMQHLWLVSAVSCGVQPEPIPDLSIACDVELLIKALRGYCINFGLEDSSLRRVAEHAELPCEQLKALVKSPLATEISQEQVVERLMEAASRAPMLPKQLVPLAAMGLPFAVVYNMLKAFVEEAAADAHRILLKVFMSHKPREESQADIPTGQEDEGGV